MCVCVCVCVCKQILTLNKSQGSMCYETKRNQPKPSV